jgi:hypothetical protein
MSLRLTFRLTMPAIPLLHPAQSRAILQRELGTAVLGLVEDLATEARRRAPVGVSGLLRASIATKVTLGTDAGHLVQGTVFTGAQVPYAAAVEVGTRPHWPPSGPGSALAVWAQRVLGDARLSFVVARAISRRGTRARYFMRDALHVVRPHVRATLQAAVDRAARLLGGRG